MQRFWDAVGRIVTGGGLFVGIFAAALAMDSCNRHEVTCGLRWRHAASYTDSLSVARECGSVGK